MIQSPLLFSPCIGNFAAQNGYFGGDFKLSRMSWIKTNFLWMMYRSGWGTKPGQEVVLAIRLERSAFDFILKEAVHSTYIPEIYSSQDRWKRTVSKSNVRLQWDPDHSPRGGKLERRAIQLGLRGEAITRYAKEWILGIDDISSFVTEQRQNAISGDYEKLLIPSEDIYEVEDEKTAVKLQLSDPEVT